MLSTTPGTGFFVQDPAESRRRILHAALVVQWRNDTYTAGQEDEARLESGQDIVVYYEFRNEFMRQPGRVDAIAETPSGRAFSFQFTGDAVSAESRQCYRVSTVMAGVTATLGGEENCPVLDVSAMGFAVIAAELYKAGEIVEATIRFKSETFRGRSRIESVRELEADRMRYGLHCDDGKSTGETLRMGLQQISAAIQRHHLRRLSRTG